MQKTVFINVKGLTVDHCLKELNSLLNNPEWQQKKLKLHSFFIINTIEQAPQKIVTDQRPQMMPVLNLTICLVPDDAQQAVEKNGIPGMPDVSELTPGMKKDLQYFASFTCRHEFNEDEPLQEDRDGAFRICAKCNAKVRVVVGASDGSGK
jgi:hypothetical protein